MSKVLELTIENLKEVGEKEKSLFIIQFYSDSCGPCKSMAPVLEALAKKYPAIPIYKVNSQVEHEVAANFEVRAVPTIVFCIAKDEIYRFVGATPLVDLEYLINNFNDPYFKEHGEFKITKTKKSLFLPITILGILLLYLLFYLFS